jgi:hypothetical protein
MDEQTCQRQIEACQRLAHKLGKFSLNDMNAALLAEGLPPFKREVEMERPLNGKAWYDMTPSEQNAEMNDLAQAIALLEKTGAKDLLELIKQH